MKTKTVLLRGVEIGAGRPKIIVPIVGKTEQEILDKAAELVQAKPDVVEWRVDYFQGVGDVQRVVDTARELNEALGEIPILFTFRTKREGGEKEIGMEDYTALNRAVAQSSYVDAQRPLLTMSMASDGVISRLCGEVFGSAATFGMVGQGSAPGQIPADQLEQVLEILHRAL